MEQGSIAAGEIRLRPFSVADVPWVYAVSLDPRLQKYVQLPIPYRMVDAEYFVREMAIGGWERGQRAEFVVEADAGEPVPRAAESRRLGRVGFGLDGSGAAQIGYWMDPSARGRGIATAAVRALCGWGFDVLGLGLIEWRAEVGNLASRRVAEKAGFRVEAVLRQRLVHRGTRVDAWIGSMLPGELPTRRG